MKLLLICLLIGLLLAHASSPYEGPKSVDDDLISYDGAAPARRAQGGGLFQTTTDGATSPCEDPEFCKDVANMACPRTYEPVCGSDGQVYTNACALKKLSCRRPWLCLRVNTELDWQNCKKEMAGVAEAPKLPPNVVP
ncbi:unnamed protein product [Vitrella brassicaformis CCMP3155]|uniref:Kazal-like domain-containing protein n=1 Tax=Vitrella brassicaformis (strain CCMP3155) TaxID=1169540 RepID=A0A0G4FUU6_VITBC|nr:unnamed protein product [Vitrella brassicaformis CCMP3155]|mmetsp:Transcript_50450/g.126424  ORF Transcript_50450/g.126424 Transcript_50450/m.126424 type:complete len:138 (-) Transcript_50450:1167-1580(-)|eukprot:CEM18721.1 unnamed protein product [Vitrella brassicaformis CCMP3155]